MDVAKLITQIHILAGKEPSDTPAALDTRRKEALQFTDLVLTHLTPDDTWEDPFSSKKSPAEMTSTIDKTLGSIEDVLAWNKTQDNQSSTS